MFSRFRAVAGGETVDDEIAFEVRSGGIVTHDVTRSGLFRPKVEYTPRYTLPITSATSIELRLFKSGSGMCDVRTGEDRVDYHVYGNAQAFAEAVEREKERAASS